MLDKTDYSNYVVPENYGNNEPKCEGCGTKNLLNGNLCVECHEDIRSLQVHLSKNEKVGRDNKKVRKMRD